MTAQEEVSALLDMWAEAQGRAEGMRAHQGLPPEQQRNAVSSAMVRSLCVQWAALQEVTEQS